MWDANASALRCSLAGSYFGAEVPPGVVKARVRAASQVRLRTGVNVRPGVVATRVKAASLHGLDVASSQDESSVAGTNILPQDSGPGRQGRDWDRALRMVRQVRWDLEFCDPWEERLAVPDGDDLSKLRYERRQLFALWLLVCCGGRFDVLG